MTGLRALLLAVALVAAPAVASAQAALPPLTAADRVLGRADAPVTVIEYASFTCSHCGDWHRSVYPAFKARFVDTGQVRLVLRDLPTPPAQLAAQAAGIARCAAPERFYDVASALMNGQQALFDGGPVEAWFDAGIAASGRTSAQIEACLADPATLNGIRSSIAGANAAGVQGTPTFFVNGRMVDDSSLAGLTAAIQPLVAGR
ncbi:thioredoxin domain-containing protein [Brevundimonas bacteroides]|uniref:thioredoxin domain-containing protein n=1 Tax=Brevundimonas bacteroides TaxID=74311 RepID=UPI000691DB48|nr:thioredoxin domain-containing protein [Brevundimonas bacteroides]